MIVQGLRRDQVRRIEVDYFTASFLEAGAWTSIGMPDSLSLMRSSAMPALSGLPCLSGQS